MFQTLHEYLPLTSRSQRTLEMLHIPISTTLVLEVSGRATIATTAGKSSLTAQESPNVLHYWSLASPSVALAPIMIRDENFQDFPPQITVCRRCSGFTFMTRNHTNKECRLIIADSRCQRLQGSTSGKSKKCVLLRFLSPWPEKCIIYFIMCKE